MFARLPRSSAFVVRPFSVSRRVFWLLAFFGAALGAWRLTVGNAQTGSANQLQTNTPSVTTLEIEKPIERELAGGQSHSYQLRLEAGQYLRVVVEQRGIDVTVSMFTPDNTRTFEIDSPTGASGEEVFAAAAAVTGIYRIEITAPDQKARPGKYQVSASGLRTLTESDLQMIGLVRPVGGELAGGQSQQYQIALRADEYLFLIVEQQELDVTLNIFDQKEQRLARFDTANGATGPELIYFAPAVAGTYTLQVKVLEKDAKPGKYEIRVGDWRKATQRDRDLTEAEIARQEGDFLNGELKLDEAVLAEERALQLFEKVYGQEHSAYVRQLQSLAFLQGERGDLTKAEQLHLLEGALREKIYGAQSIWAVRVIYHLGLVSLYRGNFAQAEQRYLQALNLRDKSNFTEKLYPARADILNYLGQCHRIMENYEKAEPLFQSALATYESWQSPVMMSMVLSNLGGMYHSQKNYDKAVASFQRAREVLKTVEDVRLAARYRYSGVAISGLASVHIEKREFSQAKELLQQELTMMEKTFDPEGLDVADVLGELADLFAAKGDLAQSLLFYQRSVTIVERLLGPTHPNLIKRLISMAKVTREQSKLPEAIDLLARGLEIVEKRFRANLIAGSERQKLGYFALYAPHFSEPLILHARYAPNNLQARRLALTSLFRFKGRILDEMSDVVASLRNSGRQEDQALLERLSTARSRLAVLTLRGPEDHTRAIYRTQLQQLEDESERLENELSTKSMEIRARLQPVGLTEIQAAIPAQSALVEFARYSLANPSTNAPAKAHYLAYVLSSQGEPRWVALGEASVIDRAVDQFRRALCRPQFGDLRCRPQSLAETRARARKLDELVMRPVRKLIGTTRRVLISPDGALNLIPFAALVDERNRYLTERYSFAYLTSGRDLLRLQARSATRSSEAVVIAAPAFDDAGGGDIVAEAKTEQQRDIIKQPASEQPANAVSQSLSMTQIGFSPLPGTAAEAETLKKLLPQASLIVGGEATEAVLKRLHRPAILHIATHGFFLKDLRLGNAPRETGGSLSEAVTRLPAVTSDGEKIENPLLRSGLALAGANKRKSGDDDGILTALEAAGLDLWGTKLVVLSACNTGVGEVKNGDGVYGLRRAFVLAGAETQVMSLWSVSDQGTKELMIAYYQRLLRGEGRGAALRQVQLQMLKQPRRSHPYYWASFIQSGEWANLAGQR